MTEPNDPQTQSAPAEDDSWVATLRRNREAAEMIRQRLSNENPRAPEVRGLPCE